jgi:hypothetical protein
MDEGHITGGVVSQGLHTVVVVHASGIEFIHWRWGKAGRRVVGSTPVAVDGHTFEGMGGCRGQPQQEKGDWELFGHG